MRVRYPATDRVALVDARATARDTVHGARSRTDRWPRRCTRAGLRGRVSAPPIALHIERRGHGQPLVLLHGWSMNLRVFDALVAQLDLISRLIAVDLPGHGRSAGAALPAGHRRARRSAAPCFHPRPSCSAGRSAARWRCARAAMRRERVAALALVSTTPRFVAARGLAARHRPGASTRFAPRLARRLSQQTRARLPRAAVAWQPAMRRQRCATRSRAASQGEGQPALQSRASNCCAHADLRARWRAIACRPWCSAGSTIASPARRSRVAGRGAAHARDIARLPCGTCTVPVASKRIRAALREFLRLEGSRHAGVAARLHDRGDRSVSSERHTFRINWSASRALRPRQRALRRRRLAAGRRPHRTAGRALWNFALTPPAVLDRAPAPGLRTLQLERRYPQALVVAFDSRRACWCGPASGSAGASAVGGRFGHPFERVCGDAHRLPFAGAQHRPRVQQPDAAMVPTTSTRRSPKSAACSSRAACCCSAASAPRRCTNCAQPGPRSRRAAREPRSSTCTTSAAAWRVRASTSRYSTSTDMTCTTPTASS